MKLLFNKFLKMGIIKQIIKGVLPFAFVKWYCKENENLFLKDLKQSQSSLVDFESYGKCKFQKIVSVQGFGFSGSGAVIDMLREYPKIKVLAYVDKVEDCGGYVPQNEKLSEIDLIRLSGGLFEIEKFLDSDNVFVNDALLHRTARLFGCSSLYRMIKEVRPIMRSFFSQISSFRLEKLHDVYYNGHIVFPAEIPDIYFLKKMSKEHYINLCRKFLIAIFNLFSQDGKEYLVADQLFSDFEMDIDRNIQYVPGLKTILVVRDPRDTYVYAVTRNVEWMEHTTVDRFIEWYKIMYHNISPTFKHKNSLVVRYEDLVYDYDNQESLINNYLGLTEDQHKLRQQYFRPAFSSRFVGMYKKMENLKDDISIIEKELTDYCNPIIDKYVE